jgi:dihydroxyacetone kinase-like protein
MFDGFTAIKAATKDSDEVDIGKLLYLAGKTLSTAAPSTTGTLLAAGMINGAKAVRGTTDMGVEEFARFMGAMLEGICSLGGAKREKKQSLTVWLRRWIS